MAGADYEIVAKLVVQDASQRGVGSVLSSLGVLQGRASSLSNSISAQFRGMFAGLAGAYGIGRLISAVGQFQVQMQDATVGLATSMSVVNRTPMTDGLQRSRKVIQELRKDARDLPGEFQDYFKGYQQIYAPVRQHGGSDETVRQLVKDTIMAGMANNRQGNLSLSFGEATRDVTQALTTGVSFRQTPIVAQALMAQGLSLEAFRKMKPEKQLETLSKAMHAYSVGAEEFNKTFSVQASTLKDNMLFTLSNFASPIFEKVTSTIREANQWFTKNNDKLREMADTWGPRMLVLWDHLIAKAGTYAAILATPAVLGAVRGLSSSSAMAGAGKMFDTFKYPIMSMIARGGTAPLAMGQLGAATTGAVAGAGTVLAPLIAVFGALMALKGAFQDYPRLVALAAKFTYELGKSFERLVTSFSFLTREGSTLNVAGAGLLIIFSGMVNLFDLAVRSISTLVLLFGMLVSVVGQLGDVIIAIVSGDKAGLVHALQNVAKTFGAGGQHLKDIWSWGDNGPSGILDAARRADAHDHGRSAKMQTPKGGDNNVHLNGPITIAVKAEVNADPTRVAYTIGSVLEQLGRNRQQARRIPVPIGG